MAEGGLRTEPKRGLPDDVSRDLNCSDEVRAQRAFEQIVNAFKHKIYGIAYRITQNAEQAQDITQQTFLKAWQHRKTYDAAYPLSAWLNTIARRTALDVVRKKSYHETSLDQLLIDSGFEPTGSTDTDREASAVDREQLAQAIDQLATTELPENIEILKLYYYQDCSYQEVQTALLQRTPPVTIKESTLAMRLAAMRDKLRNILVPPTSEAVQPIRPMEHTPANQSKDRDRLVRAIEQIRIARPDTADILYRSLVEGQTDKTLADALSISQNALALRLSKGRKILTALLGEPAPNLFSTTTRLDDLRRRSNQSEAARHEFTTLLESAGRASTVQVLKRHFIDGQSVAEIARQDGIKENSVRQAIFRASQKLEELLATNTGVN